MPGHSARQVRSGILRTAALEVWPLHIDPVCAAQLMSIEAALGARNQADTPVSPSATRPRSVTPRRRGPPDVAASTAAVLGGRHSHLVSHSVFIANLDKERVIVGPLGPGLSGFRSS